MRIRNGDHQKADVSRSGGEKLPERQRKNGLQPELAGKIGGELPDTPVSKKGSGVDGYAEKLNHGNSHRVGEGNEDGLADHVVRRAHRVPR